ncbi:hypothetical protein X759_31265 [Mesorhizobium sp. LSHC420B00]|nr:hypothetical protein X759_31265 [Mesorhizobium sp. LSHC420B00]
MHMSNIIAPGFNSISANGGLESLAADFRSFADMGVEAVELGLTTSTS